MSKNISMKFLYYMAMRYLDTFILAKENRITDEAIEIKKKVIVDYLDFVFKNRNKDI